MVLDWFYWTRMGQLDIDHAAFPNPAAMNSVLHDAGLHSLISVWLRFERESRYYDLLAAKGWLLHDRDGKPVDRLAIRSDRAGALIDSTNPGARAWYWDRIRDNIASQGFDWFALMRPNPIWCPTAPSSRSARVRGIITCFRCCTLAALPTDRRATGLPCAI